MRSDSGARSQERQISRPQWQTARARCAPAARPPHPAPP